jgi:predicted Zn finger-like uncharacterized protein
MDVRCGRCGTEYEFDDALVSERGTTVKCTNCGYQFKVHPPRAAVSAPERWVIHTTSGRELVYTSLRDLQRGIAQRQVGPDDLLTRGNQPARPLGSIAELEPFFQTRGSRPGQPRTLSGVAPPANSPTQPSAGVEPQRSPVDVRAQTVRLEMASAADIEPPTVPRNRRPDAPEARLSAPDDVIIQQPLTPTPSDVRESLRSYSEIHTDPRFVHGPASRRVRSRWIAGLVIVAVLALFGATLGRQYLKRFTASSEPGSAGSDVRVSALLEAGNRLLEDGDFEGAKEQFDKASALAEGDPHVVAALARLETIRADLVWLKLRLLDPKDKDLVLATHRELGARVGRAETAVAHALAVAPKDITVVRAHIDELRLKGDVKQAREIVGPVAKDASQPENAYVLAALDLAEPSPGWQSIIDRLRTAASAERDLGRARAALVYALVRSGNLSQAETELQKIEAREHPNPLVAELKGFVQRFERAEASDAGPDGAVHVATVDPSQLPKLDTSPKAAAEVDQEPSLPGDFRAELEQADQAVQAGDLGRAEQLYNAVLAKQPGNTEALSGLAHVAKLRDDPAKAAALYQQVLKSNPSYLPALVARADEEWASGNRQEALTLYHRILVEAGAGTTYGQHAAARIAEAASSPSKSAAPPKATSTAAPTATEAPTAAPQPSSEHPGIDTTDLPGFHQ